MLLMINRVRGRVGRSSCVGEGGGTLECKELMRVWCGRVNEAGRKYGGDDDQRGADTEMHVVSQSVR